MAFTRIEPLSVAAEDELHRTHAQDLVTAAIIHVWSVPQSDVITIVDQCRVAIPDVTAMSNGCYPDVVITIATSDVDKLKESGKLKTFLSDQWRSRFPQLKAEIWFVKIHDWTATFDIPA